MCEQYEGWSNRETWLVRLWLDNEYESHKAVTAQAERFLRSHKRSARYQLADWLRAYTEAMLPDVAGIAGDMLSGAVARIDWDEVASSYLRDARGLA